MAPAPIDVAGRGEVDGELPPPRLPLGVGDVLRLRERCRANRARRDAVLISLLLLLLPPPPPPLHGVFFVPAVSPAGREPTKPPLELPTPRNRRRVTADSPSLG